MIRLSPISARSFTESGRAGNSPTWFTTDGMSLPRPIGRRSFLFGLCLLTSLTIGCNNVAKEPSESTAPPAPTGPPLRVLVVGEPRAAASIRRFWNAVATTPVETIDVDRQTFAADPAAALSGIDVAIYPSELLARLAGDSLLLPLDAGQLDDEDWNSADLLSWEKGMVCQWGPQPVAISLGHRPWVLAYRADLLSEIGADVPTTWEAYGELVARLTANRPSGGVETDDDPWTAAVEPTADGWGGHLLLARAGAGIRHRGAYSGLFELGATQPLIGSAPYTEALDGLAAAAGDCRTRAVHEVEIAVGAHPHLHGSNRRIERICSSIR